MRKRRQEVRDYDRERKEPVVRCSICTGERVAGFLERGSNHFEEVMLVRGEEDLREFRELYGIQEVPREIY